MLWLRWPEHPALDQSLFVYYGQMMRQGLSLYTDLWDSKPPAIFLLYSAFGSFLALDKVATVLTVTAGLCTGLMAFFLVRRYQGEAAGCWAGFFALVLWHAPPFGGSLSSAQAELLMAPALLTAALLAWRPERSATFLAGLFLGLACALKPVALVMAPGLWFFLPRSSRSARWIAWLLTGFACMLLVVAIGLVSDGSLRAGVEAFLVYPRAYAAEINTRITLQDAWLKTAERFGRGLPLTLGLALAGSVACRGALRWAWLTWLAGGIAAVLLQRMAFGYHLYSLLPGLALAAGVGVATVSRVASRSLNRAALVLLLVVPLGSYEARWWWRQYAPHVGYRQGELSQQEFWLRQGAGGAQWLQAGEITRYVQRTAAPGDQLLVWGLAPHLYARAALRPATPFVLHQTFYVQGSALSKRWGSAQRRRQQLLEDFDASPPRFVVVVRDDRNGLEPMTSEAELELFPGLTQRLQELYRADLETPSYRLLTRHAAP